MQNNKQKLLLVTDTYHPRVDGTIRFIDEFIKRSKEDYNITLLAPKFGKGKKSKEVETTLLETSKYIVPLPTYPSIQISRKNLKTIKSGTFLLKPGSRIFIDSSLALMATSVVFGYLNLPCGRDLILTV